MALRKLAPCPLRYRYGTWIELPRPQHQRYIIRVRIAIAAKCTTVDEAELRLGGGGDVSLANFAFKLLLSAAGVGLVSYILVS